MSTARGPIPPSFALCVVRGPRQLAGGRHVVQRQCWNPGRFPPAPARDVPFGPPARHSGSGQIVVTHREAPGLRWFFDRTYGCVLATVAAGARRTGCRHIPSRSMAFQGANLPDAAVIPAHARTCGRFSTVRWQPIGACDGHLEDGTARASFLTREGGRVPGGPKSPGAAIKRVPRRTREAVLSKPPPPPLPTDRRAHLPRSQGWTTLRSSLCSPSADATTPLRAFSARPS